MNMLQNKMIVAIKPWIIPLSGAVCVHASTALLPEYEAQNASHAHKETITFEFIQEKTQPQPIPPPQAIQHKIKDLTRVLKKQTTAVAPVQHHIETPIVEQQTVTPQLPTSIETTAQSGISVEISIPIAAPMEAQPSTPTRPETTEPKACAQQVDTLALMQGYSGVVEKQLHQHQSYPLMARRRGIEGDVVLKFSVHVDGTLAAEPVIVASSGSDLLDRQALLIVQESLPFPSMPEGLGTTDILIPIHFRLKS